MNRSKSPIQIDSLEEFIGHAWVQALETEYERRYTLARYAAARLVEDLETLNHQQVDDTGRVLLTSIEGRAKDWDSFVKKIHGRINALSAERGVTRSSLRE